MCNFVFTLIVCNYRVLSNKKRLMIFSPRLSLREMNALRKMHSQRKLTIFVRLAYWCSFVWWYLTGFYLCSWHIILCNGRYVIKVGPSSNWRCSYRSILWMNSDAVTKMEFLPLMFLYFLWQRLTCTFDKASLMKSSFVFPAYFPPRFIYSKLVVERLSLLLLSGDRIPPISRFSRFVMQKFCQGRKSEWLLLILTAKCR